MKKAGNTNETFFHLKSIAEYIQTHPHCGHFLAFSNEILSWKIYFITQRHTNRRAPHIQQNEPRHNSSSQPPPTHSASQKTKLNQMNNNKNQQSNWRWPYVSMSVAVVHPNAVWVRDESQAAGNNIWHPTHLLSVQKNPDEKKKNNETWIHVPFGLPSASWFYVVDWKIVWSEINLETQTPRRWNFNFQKCLPMAISSAAKLIGV